MKQWIKSFERNLKNNAFIFMALVSGAVIWSTLTSDAEDLPIKFHFLFGICSAWVGVSLFGSKGVEDGKSSSNS
jgi:hypothetical protein